MKPKKEKYIRRDKNIKWRGWQNFGAGRGTSYKVKKHFSKAERVKVRSMIQNNNFEMLNKIVHTSISIKKKFFWSIT